MPPNELLRAEWVARVSALDLYIHELVAQQMREIFDGRRAHTPAYLRFVVSVEIVDRIRRASAPAEASAAFDLYVRTYLGRRTFQFPEDIAEGIRLCSDIELWNEVALKMGATAVTKSDVAKAIRKDLSLIVQRRNQIAHEGDLQQLPPREPWPIKAADVSVVAERIYGIVRAIDAVVA